MKVCFKCGIEKELGSFYVHKAMKDGHLNKCIDCTKKDVKIRSNELSKDSDWIEKERVRGREKYHRLNYKERSKELKKDKPWTNNSTYKGLRRKYKHVPRSFELHHWNYNDDYLEDVILMNISEHRRLHNLLELDIEKENI